MLLALILLLDVLILLASVRQDNDRLRNLLLELMKFFVTLLNLLVQGLIFNLQLLEIDQVKTIGELLLLLVLFVKVVVTVTKGDVLQTVLVDLLVLKALMHFPLLDHVLLQLLTGSAEHSILSDGVLKCLELGLNFLALRLLLVELSLEFGCHTIVSVLSLLQVESDLMHIGQSVEVLVLVKHLFALLLEVASGVVHLEDSSLEGIVLSLEGLVFFTLVFNSENQLCLHFGGGWQIANTLVLIVVILAIIKVVILVEGVLLGVAVVAATAVLA